jgi:hypothetical protein
VPSAESGLSRPLYVSDLDGTLLGPEQRLSPRTIGVINDLIGAGVLFTYATARSFTSASRVTAELRLEVPVVTYGGAVIVDPRSGQPRPATMMPPRAVTALQRASTAHAVQPIVFAMHGGRDRIGWLRSGATPCVEAFLARRPGDPRLLPLDSWDAIDPASVFYISVIADHEALRRLRDQVADDLVGCHVLLSEDIYTPGEYWLEVSSAAATKAAAIITLRDELGAGRLVCFGDNHNDLTMFAVADHAVAVANAEPRALRAADEVIGPNTADAVAEWLARHNRCSR